MSFDDIILSDSQYQALSASENNYIAITADNKKDYYYLRDIGFVEILPLTKQSLAPADAIGIVKTAAINTVEGVSYLRWYAYKLKKEQESEREHRQDKLHDYKLAIFSAFIGYAFGLLTPMLKSFLMPF